MWGWGYTPGGMLGHAPGGGSPADTTPGNGQYYNAVPQQVGGLVPSDEVVIGGNGSVCARALTGTVTCWGIITCGVLGVPDAGTTTGALPTVVAGVSGATHLAEPHAYSGECVVGDAGGLVCWGQNTFGEVGHAPEATPPFCSFGISGSVSAPSPVAGISNVATVTNTDTEAICATTSGGQLYCWGSQNGQLSDSGAPFPNPALVTTGTSAKALKVVSGSGHICALFDDKTVLCWGNNAYGEIGNGAIGGALGPTKANVSTAVDVFAGGNVTAALLSDGSLAIWGDNVSGVLAHTPGTANDVACGNGDHCNATPSIVSGLP
jgi:alpha-tubulin suppressor-like RCC1 family protein